MTHPGLQKYFSTLSRATKVVQERRAGKEKLRGYLNKIKIVSAQTAKKSVISSEIQQLEKHIEQMLDKKLAKADISKQKEINKQLKDKEDELNSKISKLNELLAKVGKKVEENEFKEELGEEKVDSVSELESKLYVLETKYLSLKENKQVPDYMIKNLSEKISLLKEKIREIKNK